MGSGFPFIRLEDVSMIASLLWTTSTDDEAASRGFLRGLGAPAQSSQAGS